MVLLDNGSAASRRVQAFLTACLSIYAPQMGRLVAFSDTEHWIHGKSGQ